MVNHLDKSDKKEAVKSLKQEALSAIADRASCIYNYILYIPDKVNNLKIRI